MVFVTPENFLFMSAVFHYNRINRFEDVRTDNYSNAQKCRNIPLLR